MNNVITMTDSQTAIYDGGDDKAAKELLHEIRDYCYVGEVTEVYTNDGILATVFDLTGEE
jgi:hypothetical protein